MVLRRSPRLLTRAAAESAHLTRRPGAPPFPPHPHPHPGTVIRALSKEVENGDTPVSGFATIDGVSLINVEGTGMVLSLIHI